MSEQEKQESQKTVVSFIAGLLIGGLLVWVFGGSPEEAAAPETQETATETEVVEDAPTEESQSATEQSATEEEGSELTVGDGSVSVADQPAGNTVALDGATFPTEDGWIAVRSYMNGQLGNILGAMLYSKSQGLVPNEIVLLAPTTPGREYAIVFFSEDGDREFNLANDVQIGDIAGTFVAQ